MPEDRRAMAERHVREGRRYSYYPGAVLRRGFATVTPPTSGAGGHGPFAIALYEHSPTCGGRRCPRQLRRGPCQRRRSPRPPSPREGHRRQSVAQCPLRSENGRRAAPRKMMRYARRSGFTRSPRKRGGAASPVMPSAFPVMILIPQLTWLAGPAARSWATLLTGGARSLHAQG
jgi:hypothetical protein